MSLHYARVLLTQARHFRQREQAAGWSGEYSAFLLNAAGRARREAMKPKQNEQWELVL